MEIPVRLGRVQSLQEHFQIVTSHGNLTKALYDGARGCCFTVSFRPNAKPSGAPLYLAFRNFYTAALRLVQVNTDGSSSVLLDEHALMQHIHCEDDAQNWHLLHLDKLQAKIDWSRLETFCVYLFQPSPLWEKWELQDLKFYEAQSTNPAAGASTSSADPMVAFDENQRSQ
uniref:Uncharacterized protein n=1 Tax=Globisporangium ultimum (strain ATCC 200006 / CBS 805.95 / DAOM BR144) TaxID=431595 RepID=K3WWM7_GLOUD